MKKLNLLFLTLILISSSTEIFAQEREPQRKSAAMKRFKGDNTRNALYTRFSYTPVSGIGYDPTVHRRDPSSIIKVGDEYFVWYTHCKDPKYQWLNADIWYATSKDGYNWEERGAAIERGEKGSWDDFSVFTTNILVANNRYYLVYQAEKFHESRTNGESNVVGLAWADSPHGPWTKLKDPILRPSNDAILEGNFAAGSESEQSKSVSIIKAGSFDSKCVHDPEIIPFKGKYYLYYKGHGWINDGGTMGTRPADTKWGVAIADRPEGPYKKSKFNPIMNSGHEVWVFPWDKGIAALVDFAGPEAHTMQYSKDGINFYPQCAVEDLPPAGGAYIEDKFADNRAGNGFSWGLCHVGGMTVPRNFLIRFDCDLIRDKPRDTRWSRYPFYSSVREVLYDPSRFGIPEDEIRNRRKNIYIKRE